MKSENQCLVLCTCMSSSFSLFSLFAFFSCMNVVEKGSTPSLMVVPLFSFSFYCLGFCGFYFIFIISLMGVFVILFVGVLIFFVSISILRVLWITEMFRSILKKYLIHYSSCNIFRVSIWCERCLTSIVFREEAEPKTVC